MSLQMQGASSEYRVPSRMAWAVWDLGFNFFFFKTVPGKDIGRKSIEESKVKPIVLNYSRKCIKMDLGTGEHTRDLVTRNGRQDMKDRSLVTRIKTRSTFLEVSF